MGDVSGLGRRLQDVRGNESLDSFAQQLEVHRNTLFRYEKGESYPDARIIYMLRMKFDVNPDWLITGEGPIHMSDQNPLQFDFDLLEGIIGGMDRAFLEKGTGAVFAKGTKWKWIKIVYALFSKEKPKGNVEDEAYNLFMDLLP